MLKNKTFVNTYDVFVTFGGVATHYLSFNDPHALQMPLFADLIFPLQKNYSPEFFMLTLIEYWNQFQKEDHLNKFLHDFFNNVRKLVELDGKDEHFVIYSGFRYTFLNGVRKEFKPGMEKLGNIFLQNKNKDEFNLLLKNLIKSTTLFLIEEATQDSNKVYKNIMSNYLKFSPHIPPLSEIEAHREISLYLSVFDELAHLPYGAAKLKSFAESNKVFILINNKAAYIADPQTNIQIAQYNLATNILDLPDEKTAKLHISRMKEVGFNVSTPFELRLELTLHELEHAKELRVMCGTKRKCRVITLQEKLKINFNEIERLRYADVNNFNALRKISLQNINEMNEQTKKLVRFIAKLLKDQDSSYENASKMDLVTFSKPLRIFRNYCDEAYQYFYIFYLSEQEKAYAKADYLSEWLAFSAQLKLSPQAEAFLLPNTYSFRVHLYPELNLKYEPPTSLEDWLTSTTADTLPAEMLEDKNINGMCALPFTFFSPAAATQTFSLSQEPTFPSGSHPLARINYETSSARVNHPIASVPAQVTLLMVFFCLVWKATPRLSILNWGYKALNNIIFNNEEVKIESDYSPSTLGH